MHPCGPSGLSDFTVNRSCLFLLGSIISICPYWNAPRAEKLKSTSGQSSFDKGEDILPGTYQNSQRILLNKLTIKTVVDVLHGRVNIVLNF